MSFFKTNFEVFGSRMKLIQVFDIASQTINNSWRNRPFSLSGHVEYKQHDRRVRKVYSMRKFAKFYDIKITFPNSLHGYVS